MNLATKYRPKKFNDIVCQDNVKIVLQNQIDTNEFKQAYLFCGSAGTGKTTSARIFANEINKGEGRIVEIDGASNNGVDNIRNLIDNCKMKSLDGTYKVFIIDEVHMLSIGAFNALLKILEEPPKGTIFILCTTDPQKIPATILSRVQRFDFKRIPTQRIMNRLRYIIEKENQTRTEQIEYTDEALQYIAQLAEGGMRDAITKLDTVLGFTQNITSEAVIKCLGLTSTQFILEILDNIIAKEPKNILGAIDTIFLEGKDLKLFIKDSIKVLIDVIKCQMGSSSENIPQSCQAKVTNIIEHSTPGQLLSILDSYNSLYFKIRYEHNPKIFIESELLYLCK
jgi:DNA polymerase-3 subunit gamma/tau|nr:MAG TPA: activator clamp loader [Caudoviricetes sp.]